MFNDHRGWFAENPGQISDLCGAELFGRIAHIQRMDSSFICRKQLNVKGNDRFGHTHGDGLKRVHPLDLAPGNASRLLKFVAGLGTSRPPA